MLHYLTLMRPLNGLMSVIAVFIGGLIILGPGALTFFHLYLAMLAAFLIAGGGFAINDYVDIEADKINKPKRPLPSGRIQPWKALLFSLALFIIGIILAGFINYIALAIAIINSLVLIFYSLSLQNKILIGNIAVSYSVGSTFLFGGAATASSLSGLALTGLLLLLAFFANLAREIVKDMEDIEGDRATFLKRLAAKTKAMVASAGERFDLSSLEPTLKYKKTLVLLAEASLILAILVSPLPYLLGIVGGYYLVFLVPTDILLFLALALLLVSTKRAGIRQKAKALLFGKKFYRDISKYIKLGMFFGLLAFLAGALL